MEVLVKRKRESLGLTLRQFAPLIALDHTALWRREHNPDCWSLSELEKCCQVLGTPLCALVILDTLSPDNETPREESA